MVNTIQKKDVPFKKIMGLYRSPFKRFMSKFFKEKIEPLLIEHKPIDVVSKKVQAVPVKNVQPILKKKGGKKIKGKKVLNKVVQDATAMEIDFTELADNDSISVGQVAEIDGNPATGEYVMPDGSTYKFTAGKLTKIIPELAAAAMAKKVIINEPPDVYRTAGMRKYLDSKKPKPNPTATPDNRFAGILDRYKEAQKQKRIDDYKAKQLKKRK